MIHNLPDLQVGNSFNSFNSIEPFDTKPKISVIGVGGAGGNAVNNMIESNLEGVSFIACNTDAQALQANKAGKLIKLGPNITKGLGAGSRPEVGEAAAEETIPEILDAIGNSNMVFVTAGMGGGTGTGAAAVIARAAKEKGILTVGVVTKPFNFEGAHRMRMAEMGIEQLQKHVDTLIIIPNQNLFRIANEKTTFADAFKMADDVLYAGIRGVTDLIVMPGLINLDFADIRVVMSEMGKAMMGTGDASGDRRAILAAEAAISNPLLDDVSMRGARGVLINITGGSDLTLFEVDEAANRVREEVDPDANIIFGSAFDPNLEGRINVSVVATGIKEPASAGQQARQANGSPFGNRQGMNQQPVREQQPRMGQAVPHNEPVQDQALDIPPVQPQPRPAEKPGKRGGLFGLLRGNNARPQPSERQSPAASMDPRYATPPAAIPEMRRPPAEAAGEQSETGPADRSQAQGIRGGQTRRALPTNSGDDDHWSTPSYLRRNSNT